MPELSVPLARITIPPLRARLVPRSALIERLETNVPLVLLSASAGFGKTTLLSAWARQTQSHVAWLALDEQDNDPLRFWAAVLAALRHCDPGLGEAAYALLTQTSAPPLQAVLSELLNDLARSGEETALILDDYQVIDDPGIHQSLSFVLTHAPVGLHLLLSSRLDPALPLARLRARAQLVEIRDRDLRLSAHEAECFLTQTMELHLPEAAVLQLWQRTEGWITGLQLAALALRVHTDPMAFMQAFNGSHRFILDYVQEEVLASLPPATQRFLLRTAASPAVCADLCTQLCGEPRSQQMLEQLERANCFVISLDDERRWYRYHPLLRDVLLARLQAVEPEQVPLLHHTASAWYARQGRDAEAIAHAMEAGDWPVAASLIERFVDPESWQKEYHLLRHWLTRLPADVLRTRPHLSLLLAEAIIFTTQPGPQTLSGVAEPLRQAEQGYRETFNLAGESFLLVARAVLLALQREFSPAFALARKALPLLPCEDRKWHGLCLSVLATEAVLTGQHERASTLLERALAFHQVSGMLPAIQFIRLLQGDMALCRGELVYAHSWFRQVLDNVSKQQEQTTRPLADEAGAWCARVERLAWYGLAAVAFERNDLVEAERCLQKSGAMDQLIWLHILTPGLLLYVRLLQTLGKTELARTQLIELGASVSRSDVRREIHMCLAWLALAEADLMTAQHLTNELAQTPASLTLARREEETLLRARLGIAQGQEDRALAELAPMQQEIREAGRLHRELQILILQARGLAASGEDVQARTTVLQAVTLASRAGYQRLFLEEGQRMKTLLQHLLSDLHEPTLAAFVRHLVLAFGPELAPAPDAPEEEPFVLRVPLTAQEQRVLGLLAEGASNQEIAQVLVVGLSTAKKHVSQILSKLEVQNRTQAIARARQDGLL